MIGLYKKVRAEPVKSFDCREKTTAKMKLYVAIFLTVVVANAYGANLYKRVLPEPQDLSPYDYDTDEVQQTASPYFYRNPSFPTRPQINHQQPFPYQNRSPQNNKFDSYGVPFTQQYNSYDQFGQDVTRKEEQFSSSSPDEPTITEREQQLRLKELELRALERNLKQQQQYLKEQQLLNKQIFLQAQQLANFVNQRPVPNYPQKQQQFFPTRDTNVIQPQNVLKDHLIFTGPTGGDVRSDFNQFLVPSIGNTQIPEFGTQAQSEKQPMIIQGLNGVHVMIPVKSLSQRQPTYPFLQQQQQPLWQIVQKNPPIQVPASAIGTQFQNSPSQPASEVLNEKPTAQFYDEKKEETANDAKAETEVIVEEF